MSKSFLCQRPSVRGRREIVRSSLYRVVPEHGREASCIRRTLGEKFSFAVRSKHNYALPSASVTTKANSLSVTHRGGPQALQAGRQHGVGRHHTAMLWELAIEKHRVTI